ncbi:hypothetical protein EDD85DRAFT_152377 [Armillaria nabsnona]|nr:hypothetical protein EDD85DRAFT_152377 [Armillaria nabsnona]
MRMYLVHDRDMGGFVSAFSQRMIKGVAEAVASTFCVSDPRPIPPCSQEHQNEVDVYRLLRRLQGHLIYRFYGLVNFILLFLPLSLFTSSRITFLALSYVIRLRSVMAFRSSQTYRDGHKIPMHEAYRNRAREDMLTRWGSRESLQGLRRVGQCGCMRDRRLWKTTR